MLPSKIHPKCLPNWHEETMQKSNGWLPSRQSWPRGANHGTQETSRAPKMAPKHPNCSPEAPKMELLNPRDSQNGALESSRDPKMHPHCKQTTPQTNDFPLESQTCTSFHQHCHSNYKIMWPIAANVCVNAAAATNFKRQDVSMPVLVRNVMVVAFSPGLVKK